MYFANKKYNTAKSKLIYEINLNLNKAHLNCESSLVRTQTSVYLTDPKKTRNCICISNSKYIV